MITFRDKSEFEGKINGFNRQNTRLVTDFDGTLIRPWENSWSVFRWVLWPEYTESAQRLFNIFADYERDLEHDPEKRNKMIKAWWQLHFNLFRQVPLTQQHLDKKLINPLEIRRWIWDMLRKFDDKGIPTLIFSWGISQVIEMIVKSEMWTTNSVDVLANRLGFCEQGISTGVEWPIIHTNNKTDTDVWWLTGKVKNRTHTIILGDSQSDREMITSPDDRLISVGFLTTPKRKQEKEFREVFDVVVDSDHCDGGIGNIILERILKK